MVEKAPLALVAFLIGFVLILPVSLLSAKYFDSWFGFNIGIASVAVAAALLSIISLVDHRHPRFRRWLVAGYALFVFVTVILGPRFYLNLVPRVVENYVDASCYYICTAGNSLASNSGGNCVEQVILVHGNESWLRKGVADSPVAYFSKHESEILTARKLLDAEAKSCRALPMEFKLF